jgi:Fe2+ or Zn2+ uptake regulation protein
MSSSPSEQFVVYFTQKGRKVTKQMILVVESACDRCGTFTHDDIVQATFGKASRATVFRTLARMVEAEMLRVVQFSGREVFAVAVGPD